MYSFPLASTILSLIFHLYFSIKQSHTNLWYINTVEALKRVKCYDLIFKMKRWNSLSLIKIYHNNIIIIIIQQICLLQSSNMNNIKYQNSIANWKLVTVLQLNNAWYNPIVKIVYCIFLVLRSTWRTYKK